MALYLHGLGVFNQNGSKLSIEFKEHLSLASTVQVAYSQGFDVQGLAPFQLNLQRRQKRAGEEVMTTGPGSHRCEESPAPLTQDCSCSTAHKAVHSTWELYGRATVGPGAE